MGKTVSYLVMSGVVAGTMLVPVGAAQASQARIKWGKPVWSASFNKPDALSRWYVYNSPDASPPRVPQAVHVRNGQLQLVGAVRNGLDASGGVQARYAQKYGRWEVRFRASKGAGYSAVILLWPTTEKWPDDGEIDLMEVGNPTRQSGGPWLHNGKEDFKISTPPGAVRVDFTKWHTVAVDWLPGSVTYYLDSKPIMRVTANYVSYYPKGKKVTKRIHGDYLPNTAAMNLALQLDKCFNKYVQCRNSKTPKYVTMFVDWAKIYKLPKG